MAMAFRDNGDGTITDDRTGLMWEKKTPRGSGSGDVHNVTGVYFWSAPGVTGTEPDGEAFTVFLKVLNEDRFAGHSDWRLPTRQELLSIVDASKYPRINEIFGPTNAAWTPYPTCFYWTSETADIPGGGDHNAWSVNFGTVDSQRGFPEVQSGNKVAQGSVRAVRNA
jgi:Protein of unknown function (DUF1566)